MKEKCADEDTSKEEAEKEVDKYKKDRRSKVENDIVNEMRNNVIILTLVIWFSYVFTAIIRNVEIKKDIVLVSMFVVWEGIYIFDYRRRALKELHNQEIDEGKK